MFAVGESEDGEVHNLAMGIEAVHLGAIAALWPLVLSSSSTIGSHLFVVSLSAFHCHENENDVSQVPMNQDPRFKIGILL